MSSILYNGEVNRGIFFYFHLCPINLLNSAHFLYHDFINFKNNNLPVVTSHLPDLLLIMLMIDYSLFCSHLNLEIKADLFYICMKMDY